MAVLPNSKSNISRQIELIIRKINSLATLPCVLVSAVKMLNKNQNSPELEAIINSEPTLCAMFMQYAAKKTPECKDLDFSSSTSIKSMSPQEIRNVIMSAKIYPNLAEDKTPVRFDLVKFAILTAIASRQIALIADSKLSDMAYKAGLLSNIGKFVLDDTMPKSFEKITAEAKNFGEKDVNTERKYLGIDHIIIGKRLAEKWQFPSAITNAIWMHRSDEEVIESTLEQNNLALIVRLGYLIAKNTQIADCGSYEPSIISEEILKSLSLEKSQISEIQKSLNENLNKQIALVNLDSKHISQNYNETVWDFASKLAKDNATLEQQNIKLSQSWTNMNFANEFLAEISSTSQPADIAISLAKNLNKFYSAAPIAICLIRPSQGDILDTITMNSQGNCDFSMINCPDIEQLLVPKLEKECKIIVPNNDYEWLFNQLEIKFDISKTRMFPILIANKSVAIIVCQFAYMPSNMEHFDRISSAAALAGHTICFAYSCQSQQRLAEEFSALLLRLGNIKEKLSKTQSVDSLVELAGGAAHELNNPITVVSGRIQMLLSEEKNETTKQTLSLIKEKTEEISNIVSDLMLFAKPQSPDFRLISPAVLIDSAVDIARTKLGAENAQVEIENLDNLRDVNIDTSQISNAIANLIANAYDSYHDTGGIIRITGAEQSENSVRIQIIDQGCGMSDDTLQKVFQPFFSGKPAGRKRGMGLSHTLRLLQINNGSIHLSSKIGQGTTATVMLPCK